MGRIWAFFILGLLIILAKLAIFVGVIWIAWHFIVKYW